MKPPLGIQECLFHYTSTRGLLGIIKDKCIWATDSAFLNDSSELLYAGRAVQRLLNNLVRHINLTPPPEGSDDWHRLDYRMEAATWLKRFINPDSYADSVWAQTFFDGATYVSCFTENPDQLSQWRGYGGNGYSLGFTKEGLNRLQIEGESSPAGDIVRVRYGTEGLDELYQDLATYFANRPGRRVGISVIDELGETLDYMLPRLARFKHDAFEEELEWRIAVSRYRDLPITSLCFRDGARVIPYIRLRFEPSDLAVIYIGPGGDIQDERALKHLLAANGYNVDLVSIEHSRAPFRGA